MRLLCLFLLIGLVTESYAYSMPAADNSPHTVTGWGKIEIIVSGNKRTSERYINYLVIDCLEEQRINSLQQGDANKLEQCLLNSRVFAGAKVAIRTPSIEVTVVERWTLIPIPYFYTKDGEYTAGLFLMESNFLGQGKKTGIGGNLSDDGNSLFVYYLDPAILFSDWSGSIQVGSSTSEPIFEIGGTEYYSFEVEQLKYGFTVGRKVLFPDLSFSLGMDAKERSYKQADSYLPPNNYDSFSVKARLDYRDTDFKFYFNEGIQATLEYESQVYRSDEQAEAQEWSLTFDWQKQVLGNHAFQIRVQLQEVLDATMGDSLMLGRDKGFRGIENKAIWANRAQSLSLDYQYPVKSYGYGTWTIAPFVDITRYDPIMDLPEDTFFSSGIGGYLFLKSIAFPGIGLVVGYTNEYEDMFFSLSLGMRM